MTPRRPEIFVSATSSDLRSCRQLIKEALLTLGGVPVEQTNFPPDYRTVRDMLRTKIAACDAVVHLAGEVYGAEPRERAPAEPRRSYTQLEYDLARELKKPLYLFVCGDDFPYDEHPPEAADQHALQQAHRAVLLGSETLRYQVSTRDDLALKIHELQTSVEHLTGELKKSRSHLVRGVTIGLVALALLAGGLWVVNQRTGRTEVKVAQLETELDKQRRYIKAVADAFTEQQSQLRQLQLTDDEIFSRAVASVATREKIPEAELRSGITLFVAAIRTDPKAGFYDRALAEFAQKNFAAAAESAGQAGNAARDQYLAADKLVAQVAAQADKARTYASEAFDLQGQAFYAGRKFGEAVTAFEAALAATPRATQAREWAKLQARLGLAADFWSAVSTGDSIAERRTKAIAAYRAALEVYTREALPQDWAATQSNLAITLRDQAAASVGPARARLLAEAIAAYRATLEVKTREAQPKDWAMIQNNLANALVTQARTSIGVDRARLLAEAVAVHHAVLTVFSRDALPRDWAGAQNNLATALGDQAAASSGPDRVRLLAEAVAANHAALMVFTRDALPRDWAGTQNNLANALRAQAAASTGPDRTRLLAEAIAGYRAALEVRTRAALPQDWAMSQTNLARTLWDQARDTDGPESARLLAEAVAGYRAALEVGTREAFPQQWAMIQGNLARALRAQAAASAGPDRARLLAEAIRAGRLALEIFTASDFPSQHREIAAILVGTQADLDDAQTADK